MCQRQWASSWRGVNCERRKPPAGGTSYPGHEAAEEDQLTGTDYDDKKKEIPAKGFGSRTMQAAIGLGGGTGKSGTLPGFFDNLFLL